MSFEPRGGDEWRTRPTSRASHSDINSNSLVFRLEYGIFGLLWQTTPIEVD
jgi:hypothetical protein